MNKKQTEGVILFPQLPLQEQCVIPFVFTVPSSTLYYNVRVTHPDTSHIHVA